MKIPRVYTGTHTGPAFRALRDAGADVGLLYSAGYWKNPKGAPYVIDNGIYARFLKGLDLDKDAFARTLERAKECPQRPVWVAVPDKVGDLLETNCRWQYWANSLRTLYGFPLCYVAQDGATADDVPEDAAIVAIGGSTPWKWGRIGRQSTIRHFVAAGLRVHVLRVNTGAQLRICAMAAVESVDGSGWFRAGDGRHKGNPQLRQLQQAFGLHRPPTPEILCS